MITAYLHTLVGDWHEAADLTQDTFVIAHQKMAQFDPSRSLAAWLRGIARNLARNDIRKKYRHREFLVEGDAMDHMYSAMDQTESGETWDNRLAALDDCMNRLPEKQRQVVDSHYREHKSAKDIASIIGVLERSVFQLLWQARKNLKDCIASLLRFGEPAHD